MTFDLRLGSCLDPMSGLASLGDKSIDVTITDPPYSAHVENGQAVSGRRSGQAVSGRRSGQAVIRKEKIGVGYMTGGRRRDGRMRSMGVGDMGVGDMGVLCRELVRVTKRWILIFCAWEQLSDYAEMLDAAGGRYVRCCAWEKPDGTPQLSGDRPATWGECLVVGYASDGLMRWNGGGKRGLYKTGVCRGAERSDHPTQKPLDLMFALVEDFTDPGEIVLDPFTGSGSTGVAAIQLGRRFVGWELARCERCAETAQWRCVWDGQPRPAFLCEGHHASMAGQPGFRAQRDNYHAIATRRLSGDEAKPRPEQPSLFGGVT